MLVREYRELNEISLKELKKIWKGLRNDVLIIGGWAAHFLSNERFKAWKGIDYVGSKDIDFGIRAKDVETIAKKLERLGYIPINFRFYKIFSRSTSKPIDLATSKKMPLFEIFYLYVDLILDEKLETKTTFFSDPLLKFCFENGLFVKKNDFKIIKAEPLVLSKLRMLENRDEEKRIKDILDCIFVSNFSDFDASFFQEISSLFKVSQKNKKIAQNILGSHQVEMELADLRLDAVEIKNLKTAFLSLTIE